MLIGTPVFGNGMGRGRASSLLKAVAPQFQNLADWVAPFTLLREAGQRLKGLQASVLATMEQDAEAQFDKDEAAYQAYAATAKFKPVSWEQGRKILAKLETAYRLAEQQPGLFYQVGSVRMFHQSVVPLQGMKRFDWLNTFAEQLRADKVEAVMRIEDDGGELIQFNTIQDVWKAVGRPEEVTRIDRLGTEMQLNQLMVTPGMEAIQNITGYALQSAEKMDDLVRMMKKYPAEVRGCLTLELDESWIEMLANGTLTAEDLESFSRKMTGVGVKIGFDDITVDRAEKALGLLGWKAPEGAGAYDTGLAFGALMSCLKVASVKLEILFGDMKGEVAALREVRGSLPLDSKLPEELTLGRVEAPHLDRLADFAVGLEDYKRLHPALQHPDKIMEKNQPEGMERVAQRVGFVMGKDGHAIFAGGQWLVGDNPKAPSDLLFGPADEMAQRRAVRTGQRMPQPVELDYTEMCLDAAEQRYPKARLLYDVLDYSR